MLSPRTLAVQGLTPTVTSPGGTTTTSSAAAASSTQAKLAPPIPQDKIGETFVWRDWLNKLSNKVYGSMAQQDSSKVAITGGSITGITIRLKYVLFGDSGGGDSPGVYYDGSVDRNVSYNTVGAEADRVKTVSSAVDYAIALEDRIVKVTVAGKTATLPTAVGVIGRRYIIKNSSAGNITLATTGAETIDGVLTWTLPKMSAITVFSDGTGWGII
jgi:hypothetical protein